ncbi:uridine kinase family protein [Mesobacillus subterraneus]|uniref:Uridine kinase n=1 Tax=Mesobacillus subterraneus TaxID=285983 RepID=A0A427TRE3_9BACI|nr:AAA family ATPase [Mesobacillus subterraneus]RSD26821.1 uridine kinase [Mesobacillus subterraneus]
MKFLKGPYDSFDTLLETLPTLPRKARTLLIGVDGCGGSGKSTFSRELRESLANVTVVHKDDFYLPSGNIIKDRPENKPIGADFDWRRLREQVLEPLSSNQEGHYQRYDWNEDRLAEFHTVPVGGIVIIEGVYSTRDELQDFYDLKIWVECPRELRLARGIERDGEGAREMWEANWMVGEDMYVEQQKPLERADIVLSGTP